MDVTDSLCVFVIYFGRLWSLETTYSNDPSSTSAATTAGLCFAAWNSYVPAGVWGRGFHSQMEGTFVGCCPGEPLCL